MRSPYLNWDVTFDEYPALGSSPETEVVVWRDNRGPLTISTIGSPDRDIYRLRMEDGEAIDVYNRDRRIVARPRADIAEISTSHFLSDQVFPRILSHQGKLVVHAGAIQAKDSVFLLLGASGRGKSTLTASFDQAGYPLLGDDAMILSWGQDPPRAEAVYRSLRLLPDSIEALLPPGLGTESVTHYSPKRRVDVSLVRDGAQQPGPLRAIFLLDEPPFDGEIRVRPLSTAEACMVLIENSFALDPARMEGAQLRMEQSSAVARTVPAFELSYPRVYARLPEVRRAILEKVDEINRS